MKIIVQTMIGIDFYRIVDLFVLGKNRRTQHVRCPIMPVFTKKATFHKVV